MSWIVPVTACKSAPIALLIRLDEKAPRYIEEPESHVIEGIPVPLVRLWPHSPVLALRAEFALSRFGLA